MAADAHVRSVRFSACILPSGLSNVSSNTLLDFIESSLRGWRVSRGQAVRALSPGCLPWILPKRETDDFPSQWVRKVASSLSESLATSLRDSSPTVVGIVAADVPAGKLCILLESVDLATGCGG